MPRRNWTPKDTGLEEHEYLWAMEAAIYAVAPPVDMHCWLELWQWIRTLPEVSR